MFFLAPAAMAASAAFPTGGIFAAIDAGGPAVFEFAELVTGDGVADQEQFPGMRITALLHQLATPS